MVETGFSSVSLNIAILNDSRAVASSRLGITHMLHHSQSFYEQAFLPVPQEMNFLVEQAEKPVPDNGARCEV